MPVQTIDNAAHRIADLGDRGAPTIMVREMQSSEAWRDFENKKFGSLFSSQAWAAVLRRTYGFNFSSALTSHDGSTEAILFSRIADIRGERIISLPFTDYCDPQVENSEAWTRLAGRLLSFRLPVTLRCLRNRIPLADRRFTCAGRALWHAVDLKRPEQDIWAGLAGSARQNIRKAQRCGITVRAAKDLDAMRIFHDMHALLRKRKYRMLAQPLHMFEAVHEVFAPDDAVTVLLAEIDGKPVAGILLLMWQDTLYYKFNASIESRLGANDLLAWEAIRLGQQRGLSRLDFGRSDEDQPGLIRYKRKFASEEAELFTLRHVPQGYRDQRGEDTSHVLGQLTKLLTEPAVPDEITAAAGDELYRYFC